MNLRLPGAALLLITCALRVAAEPHVPTLALGSSMPQFELLGVDGQLHKSSEWASAKVLVVVFTCNHCPTAQLYEGRIKSLVTDYASKDVSIIAIQPNNPTAIRLDELAYTDVSDSYPEMKIRAAYQHFNFPYLYDGDTQEIARMFGPSATPHAFVFGSSRHLRYEGRIDDSPRESKVTRRDLREAIDAMLLDRPVIVPHTPSIGCSTKWLYKAETRSAQDEAFAQEPVTVADVTADQLKKLAEGTNGKVVLVDFWATWCGPCLAEMPDMIKLWRMYRSRSFEFVSVAVNYPDERKGVLATLEKGHASMRNLIFGAENTYALMKAFDPEWDAAVPFTVLIGPDGKVLWKYQGELNMLSLKRRILASLPDDTYYGQKEYWKLREE